MFKGPAKGHHGLATAATCDRGDIQHRLTPEHIRARPIPALALAESACGEVVEAMIDRLDLSFSERLRHRFGRDSGGTGFGEMIFHPCQEIEKISGGLLAGFDTGLVVGINVHEAGIEGNRPLIQGDESSEGIGVQLIQRNRHGKTTAFVESIAGAPEESLEKVTGRSAVLVDRYRASLPGGAHFDEGRKEVQKAVSKLLHIGVLIG